MHPPSSRGIALLAFLIMLAAMSAGLAATGMVWHQTQQRAKEQELIFIGLEYMHAIRSYYNASPEGRFPRTLDELLKDERSPGLKRHLRRPYLDPLTKSPTWGIVAGPDGGIMGIYSLAEGTPIKRGNFPPELNWAGAKSSYAEWQFIYLPPSGKFGFGAR